MGVDLDEMIDFQIIIKWPLIFQTGFIRASYVWLQTFAQGRSQRKWQVWIGGTSHAWLKKVCMKAILTKMSFLTSETNHAWLQYFA